VEDADRNKDGKIDFGEWEYMGESLFFIWCLVSFVLSSDEQSTVKQIKHRIPMAEDHLQQVSRFHSDRS
jgi:hypothetical protein